MSSKFKLAGVSLDEISLVDLPADPNAKIVVWKRGSPQKGDNAVMAKRGEKTKGGSTMDPKELAKKLEALEGQVNDLTKAKEEADAKIASFEKAADAAGLDVVQDGETVALNKRADAEYIDVDGEKILKSSVPASILKKMEASAEENRVLKAKQDEIELAKRGEEALPNLAGTPLAKGKLLKAIEGLGEEALNTLKAADAVMAQHMLEKGANPLEDESSATHRLDKMAREYQAAHPGVQYETAYAEVSKSGEGAVLLQKSRAENS